MTERVIICSHYCWYLDMPTLHLPHTDICTCNLSFLELTNNADGQRIISSYSIQRTDEQIPSHILLSTPERAASFQHVNLKWNHIKQFDVTISSAPLT